MRPDITAPRLTWPYISQMGGRRQTDRFCTVPKEGAQGLNIRVGARRKEEEQCRARSVQGAVGHSQNWLSYYMQYLTATHMYICICIYYIYVHTYIPACMHTHIHIICIHRACRRHYDTYYLFCLGKSQGYRSYRKEGRLDTRDLERTR